MAASLFKLRFSLTFDRVDVIAGDAGIASSVPPIIVCTAPVAATGKLPAGLGDPFTIVKGFDAENLNAPVALTCVLYAPAAVPLIAEPCGPVLCAPVVSPVIWKFVPTILFCIDNVTVMFALNNGDFQMQRYYADC